MAAHFRPALRAALDIKRFIYDSAVYSAPFLKHLSICVQLIRRGEQVMSARVQCGVSGFTDDDVSFCFENVLGVVLLPFKA